MTREQIQRMLDGFRADMEKVMLEPEHAKKDPQFEERGVDALLSEMEFHFAVMLSANKMECLASLARRSIHVANYAMMIHWHAEQRRLEERQ